MTLYTYSLSLLILTTTHLALAVQCPPSYVFDEILPLHPSSCSAITLCVSEDGSSHFPTFDNTHLPCPSTLIALQCPEVLETAGSDGAETECEYSLLNFDHNGFLRQACCDTFDLVFRSLDVAPQGRFLRGDVLGGEVEEMGDDVGDEFEDEWDGEGDEGEFEDEDEDEDESEEDNDEEEEEEEEDENDEEVEGEEDEVEDEEVEEGEDDEDDEEEDEEEDEDEDEDEERQDL